MPHIPLPPGTSGISGPLQAYPETGKHLLGLANALLRGPSSLTPGERELIATYVSAGNSCFFCTQSHASAARELLPVTSQVDDVLERGSCAAPTPKLRALLEVADLVRVSGKSVSTKAVEAARAAGADDQAIHDTVLIAAAFCMYNRYVDGLATTTPDDPSLYVQMGRRLAKNGY